MTLVLGDFGRLNPAPIHGWNVATLAFLPVTVDATGALITSGGGGGGGTVDQGASGADAWLITGTIIPFTTLFEYSGTNPLYYGRAAQGSATSAAVWQVRQFTFDGSNNMTAMQFANGSAAYAFKWDDRASFSYS